MWYYEKHKTLFVAYILNAIITENEACLSIQNIMEFFCFRQGYCLHLYGAWGGINTLNKVQKQNSHLTIYPKESHMCLQASESINHMFLHHRTVAPEYIFIFCCDWL